ncbi:MAG TPA: SUMF1/EgtB/PvdO family nonheme iron enzyme [Myxococcota bacterium]|nr:SUMF1/EgtB/PvdO family nonheme iron enzyme [Myxococcota bacterium]HRY93606.1 SUMF1/EgtB/PvdO family nonheme iron enzyme [Myxococcota bacterium]
MRTAPLAAGLLGIAFALTSSSIALAQDRPIVAVFDIEPRGVKLSKAVRDNLSDYLGGLLSVRGYQVVPRSQLRERLIAQKKASYKECYDQSCQVELGKELAADKSLSTRVFALGGKCRVVVTLYDLKRSASEGAGMAVDACDEPAIVRSLEKAVEQLGGGVVAGGKAAPPALPEPPANPAALTWLPSRPAGIEFAKSEVTVAQYRACVDAGKCSPPNNKSDSQFCNWGYPDRDSHPVNCVDWNQAQAFCAWAGGRLPTEQEWRDEANDGGKRPYPWGHQEGSCERAVWGLGGRGCGRNSTWPVCSKPTGSSVSRLCDLYGNVEEWVLLKEGNAGVSIGGSWGLEVDIEPILYSILRVKPGTEGSSADIGFRCVRESR